MLTSALRHLVYGTTILTLSVMLTACGGSSGGSGSSSSSSSVVQASSSSVGTSTSSADDTSSSSDSSSSSEASSSSSSIADTTPDDFGFTSLENQQPGEIVTSETIIITGIDDAAEITIQNGQYAIDESDDFTEEAGQIRNEQTLTLQTTASDTPSTTKEVTVTVGGVSAVFTVSTVEDTDPPEAAFVFPPPMTATEGNTVIVRGTAEDELSAVASVTLTVSHEGGTNDFEAESTDDFATWQKQVNLGPGENTITVIAEDKHGNTLTDGASVTVVQQTFAEAFPADAMEMTSPRAVVFDADRNRLLVADAAGQVVAVDFSTSVRSVFVNSLEGLPVDSANGLVIDKKRDRLLVSAAVGSSNGTDGVIGVDLVTGEKDLVSSRTQPSEDQPSFSAPSGIAIDPSDSDQGFVLGQSSRNLVILDLETGLRTLISDNDMPDSGPEFREPTRLLVDSARGRILVGHNGATGILSVDLSTGVREVFLGENNPEGTPLSGFRALVSDNLQQRILVSEIATGEVWSVDIETRAITVLSGGGVPHSHNPMQAFTDMALSPSKEFLVGTDWNIDTLFVIDVQTGERLVLTKRLGES